MKKYEKDKEDESQENYLMKLMKDLYVSGDDKTKKVIEESWQRTNEKKMTGKV